MNNKPKLKLNQFDSLFVRYFVTVFLICSFVLITAVVSITLYYNHTQSSSLNETCTQNHLIAQNKVDNVLGSAMVTASYIESNSNCFRFLTQKLEEMDYRQKSEYRDNIVSIFRAIYMNAEDSGSIELYSYPNNMVCSLDEFQDIRNSFNFSFFASLTPEKRFIIRFSDKNSTASRKMILSYIYPVRTLENDFSYVIVNIPFAHLGTNVSYELESKSQILLTVDENVVLYSSNSAVGSPAVVNNLKNKKNIKIDKSNYVVSESVITGTDISLYTFTNIDRFRSARITTYTVALLSTLICLILAIMISYMIARKLFSPISVILDIIDSPENFESEDIANSTELKYISKNIVKNFSDSKELEKNLSQRLKLLKKVQNMALYSQITPHFLYNTLQLINLMAIEDFKGDNRVSETITILADMFRISLKEGENLITLKTEIIHAKKYEQIQKLKYPEYFNIKWDIPEQFLNFYVPKIIFQPLIENAVSHGQKEKKEKIQVRIKAESIPGNVPKMKITVEDNGSGMSEQDINKLNHQFKTDYISSDHIGLKNINLRIKLSYGDDYGMTLSKSEEYGGLKVTLVFPCDYMV